MGQYEQAEPLYLESKKIKEKIAGKENIGYARACNNLAIFYMTLGQYKKAEPLLLEQSTILKKVLGTGNPDYAYCCSNLADLYIETHEFKKAEILLYRSKKNTGKNNWERAS